MRVKPRSKAPMSKAIFGNSPQALTRDKHIRLNKLRKIACKRSEQFDISLRARRQVLPPEM
jgi:hypothetical protein